MPDLAEPLPSALRAVSRWLRLPGPHGPIPVMLAHPRPESGERVPFVVWMHGRTVRKEIDPGRYLRLVRAGIGVCAVDLPGHGERLDPALQHPTRTLDVVLQMSREIDAVVEAAAQEGPFDAHRAGVGGMSAGGMATLNRLTSPHDFACTSVEATTGSWRHQQRREMFQGVPDERIASDDPIRNLDAWREIPLQAFHSRQDEWVDVRGQEDFLGALRTRYRDPDAIEFVLYEHTGAPHEHAGFGRFAADAKNRQREFFSRHLAG